MLPAALMTPAVTMLAPVMLPLELITPEFKLVSVPTLVILAWAAVVNEPDKLVALTLPPVMLPVADIRPPVNTLPPVMLPVALTVPAVTILPPVMLPVTDCVPVSVPFCESSITVLPLILIAIFVLLYYELG